MTPPAGRLGDATKTIRRSDGRRCQQSDKRVNDFEKGEAVEVGIAGADSPKPMLTHKDGRMSVVQHIARQSQALQAA